MECELLKTCAFFQKYSAIKEMACQGFINRYCKGPEMDNCKRKEYRRTHGAPPPEDMMPSGFSMKK